MSHLTRNQLFTRRNFFRRAAEAATTVGAGAVAMKHIRAVGAQSAKANPWAYDDTPYRHTDPKLIGYHETARFKTAHPSPRCISLAASGNLLIACGKTVTEHKTDGSRVSEFKTSAELRCLGSAEADRIYVGCRDHIEVLDGTGQQRETWKSPGAKAYLTALAIGTEDVFVADAGSRLVWRYDRAGKLKGKIGAKDSARKIPGFIIPSPFFDVEVAADGLLRVANTGRHSVEAYTFDGDLEFAWGRPGAAIGNFCGCCNPISLALLPDGRTVTFEKGIPRVKVCRVDGELDTVVAGPESFAENARVCGPNDCTVGGLDGVADPAGRIFILDLVAADVRVMERKTG